MPETIYDALRESHKIRRSLLRQVMSSLEPAGDAWIEKARELSHEVRHRLREEEKKSFQMSGKILSDAQKTRLAKQYRKDYLRMHRMLEAR